MTPSRVSDIPPTLLDVEDGDAQSRLLVSASSINFFKRSSAKKFATNIGGIALFVGDARILRRHGRGRAGVFGHHCAAGKYESHSENWQLEF